MKYVGKSVVCRKEAHCLTVSWPYMPIEDKANYYLITNDKGDTEWYSKDIFNEATQDVIREYRITAADKIGDEEVVYTRNDSEYSFDKNNWTKYAGITGYMDRIVKTGRYREVTNLTQIKDCSGSISKPKTDKLSESLFKKQTIKLKQYD